MLLEFELENDAAFASASAISLISGRLKDKEDGRLVDIGDVAHTKALTSALILGKNGSGKSTLVEALRFVSSFVRNSSKESQQGDPILYTPNLLVNKLSEQPTRYRLTFSMYGTVYDFEFSHDETRVTYERLQVADKSVRFRRMYERSWEENEKQYTYIFGDALSGRRQIWLENTRENALFLSTASQLNAEDIKPAFEWLSKYLRSTNISSGASGGVTARMCLDDKSFKKRVVSFLQAMDINVKDIIIEEEEFDEKSLSSTFSSDVLQMIRKSLVNGLPKKTKVYFEKNRKDKIKIRFPLSDESTGTQALFNLAGPLFDSLKKGHCLLIDEINTSLHPVVVSFLINMFADKRQNLLRAQLIFTSHDTSVLSQQRMRRDQVWIIENHGESAALVPLSDFSPRKGEALDKGYLGGRYGGIPIVSPVLLADWDDK